MNRVDYVIIGAGLTGLTTAYNLLKKGKTVRLIERNSRVGGQINSFEFDGFTFESGPNTGVVSNPEVAELFNELSPLCSLEVANKAAKKRLIWKGRHFYPLPSNLKGAIFTPLFSFYDKLRVLGEPFRKVGDDPNESVGHLAERRLGKSFVEYAVDPFISGIYAGDPMTLTTRYALPKLYNLEHNYGSFVKGTIALSKIEKSDRDKLATKEVFSAKGGLGKLIDALHAKVGDQNIVVSAKDAQITKDKSGYTTTFTIEDVQHSFVSDNVVTTSGAYTLEKLLPFIPKEDLKPITDLKYAPVVQVSVGFDEISSSIPPSFGGLVPSKEKKDVLGILFPSYCFSERAPEGSQLLSIFLGGIKHPEIIEKSDKEIEEIVEKSLRQMLEYSKQAKPHFIRIFRHKYAIPQYDETTGAKLAAIEAIQKKYEGLEIAGNLKGGISMADRIKQGYEIANK